MGEDRLATIRADNLHNNSGGQVLPQEWYTQLQTVRQDAKKLANSKQKEKQFTKKLADAIAKSGSKAISDNMPLTGQMEVSKLWVPVFDKQIFGGARLADSKAQELELQGAFDILELQRPEVDNGMARERGDYEVLLQRGKLLKRCQSLIHYAKQAHLPRIVVAATLAYARVSLLGIWFGQKWEKREVSNVRLKDFVIFDALINATRQLLKEALDQCLQVEDATELLRRTNAMLQLLETQRDDVTPSQLASITLAMVRDGIVLETLSGQCLRMETPFCLRKGYDVQIVERILKVKTTGPLQTLNLTR
ncbi:hypothetical protein FPSE_06914 [Fusarium pseudograminearum CS3096]|uniref:Uncharacterized protein n=1 Tax=Fusarium pseudograminearum (strain CS3096) TaxID=1028729 RepID=K3VIC9_FUSPC|nr:hypothetical protein FPSE_06914 [Fusarium pseudograminearum CS3096]EKJ72868.1 hypothetical protein FPSE_06914 [Fusarium pseudograminearum CS3096]